MMKILMKLYLEFIGETQYKNVFSELTMHYILDYINTTLAALRAVPIKRTMMKTFGVFRKEH